MDSSTMRSLSAGFQLRRGYKASPRRGRSSRRGSLRGNLRSWFSLRGLGASITIPEVPTVSFGVKHYRKRNIVALSE